MTKKKAEQQGDNAKAEPMRYEIRRVSRDPEALGMEVEVTDETQEAADTGSDNKKGA